jgi:adenylate cyclase
MSPPELVSLLNEYLTEMTAIIQSAGGIIDKYEGDAIMAEFGAPLALSNHADLAVHAGLQMQRRMDELRQIWEKRGLPILRCRVGINSGSMIVGNMGSQQVCDYTVIGDAVNLASRLESANKFYRTHIMISEYTYTHLSSGMFRTRVLDVIKVQGKARAVKVLEVRGNRRTGRSNRAIVLSDVSPGV